MALFDLDPLLNAMLDTAPGISDLNLSVGRRWRSTARSTRWPTRASRG
jgi:hypothetical protein